MNKYERIPEIDERPAVQTNHADDFQVRLGLLVA